MAKSKQIVETSTTGYMDKFIKLIAHENLTVLRSGHFKTASIDLKNRVVKIPAFASSNEAVSVLMSAHEVSHALNTPTNWYHTQSKDNYPRQLLQCINIVEDIRIERIIKNKYIGLRSVFIEGYKAMLEDNFFGDLNRNLCFADMVNIWSKVGNLSPVRITNSKDYAAYKYIATAVTFDDVIPRAKFLLAYNKSYAEAAGSMTFNPDFETSGSSDSEAFDTADLTPEELEELESILTDAINGNAASSNGTEDIQTDVSAASDHKMIDHSRDELMVPREAKHISRLPLGGIFA